MKLGPVSPAQTGEAERLGRRGTVGRRVIAANLFLKSRLLEAADALRASDIDFVVLKGVPLALRLYGRLDSRAIVDNDILVRREEVRRAYQVLCTLGYRPPPFRVLDAHLAADFQFCMTRGTAESLEPPLDLHWNAFHPCLYRVSESLLWQRCEQQVLDGRSVKVFDRPMTLVHLASHFAQHYFLIRRSLVDFAAAWNLWHDTIEEEDLVCLARSTGLIHALDFSFLACRDLGMLERPPPSIGSRRAAVLRRVLPSSDLFHAAEPKSYLRRLMPLVLTGPVSAVRWIRTETFPPLEYLAAIHGRATSPALYLRYFQRPLRPLRNLAHLLGRPSFSMSRVLNIQAFRKARPCSAAGGVEVRELSADHRSTTLAVFLDKGALSRRGKDDLEAKFAGMSSVIRTVLITRRHHGPDIQGTTVMWLPSSPPGPIGSLIFYGLGSFLSLRCALRAREAAIICGTPFEAFAVLQLRRMLPLNRRPRVALEVHGDWGASTRLYGSKARKSVAFFADSAAFWALRHADLVRAVSAYTQQLVRQAGYRGPIHRFLPANDLSGFFKQPAEPPSSPRVAFVGAIERVKGVDILIRAWALVVQEVPQARLVLAGNGSELRNIRRIAKAIHVDTSLEFLGQVTHSKVMHLLDDSQFLVLPSRSEGFGMVLLESFLRARPVVATSAGAIPELVQDRVTGALVPPGDPAALAEAIVALLTKPDEAKSRGQDARRMATAMDLPQAYSECLEIFVNWINRRSRE